MFNILGMCDDYILGNFISILKRSIELLGLIVPILLIIGATISIIKGVLNPEDKTVVKKVANSFLSAIIVLLLPYIINTTMRIISTANKNSTTKFGINENGKTSTFNFATCWANIKTTNVNPQKSNVSSYEQNKKVAEEQENSKYRSAWTAAKKDWEKAEKEQEKQKAKEENNNNNNNNSNSNVTSATYNKVVLIGDSRFHGSDIWYKIGNDKTVYIAEGGTGLQYIKNQINNIRSHDSEKTAFVINSGINDRAMVNSYISYLNEQAKTFKGKLYYLSVNPVEESKEGKQYFTTNQEVNQFNEKMKAGLDSNYITYLDSNSYLKANGYNTSDGIHYDKETSQKIYDFITQYVKS